VSTPPVDGASYTPGMNGLVVSLAFAAALLLSLCLKLWLTTRQIRHVAEHRDHVPAAFADRISLASHQKAADYTLAKGRLNLLATAFGTAVLLGWTLLGGLDVLNTAVLGVAPPSWGPLGYQLLLLAAFALISGLVDLPVDLYSTFVLEQRFGFNRMTPRLYAADMVKSLLLGVVIGLPLAALILWIMGVAGAHWWLWAWYTWTGFQLLLLWLFPTFIAPLFNRFQPLADESLKQRVQALMQRCGFAAKGLFVMDGSRRSAHANAYFTGLGNAKRVVFFDTLLNKLNAGEVEAVLAHELGHFKHRHVLKRMIGLFAFSLAALALLGWLAGLSGFYRGLGVQPNLDAPNDALALLLFLQVVPVFGFFVSPLLARSSRRHEFQADAFACRQADGRDLANALLKLHEDNAGTLTPDPVYARFYYSHPPATERLAALQLQAR
jgi:STE24 endopeptidase